MYMHCYIAAVRADLQVDTITMPATGFLSMSKDAAASKNYLSPAVIRTNVSEI